MKVLKIKSVLSVHAPMVFKFFCCLVMEKLEVKFWLASMKTLTVLIFKILTELSCCIQEASCDFESNTGTPFKKYFNFPASSPAYGPFYITGGFLHASTQYNNGM
jgi:hypothetical protein